MSVSEIPILKEDEERSQTHYEEVGDDKWSPRLRFLIVVLSSLILWSGIFLLVSWLF